MTITTLYGVLVRLESSGEMFCQRKRRQDLFRILLVIWRMLQSLSSAGQWGTSSKLTAIMGRGSPNCSRDTESVYQWACAVCVCVCVCFECVLSVFWVCFEGLNRKIRLVWPLSIATTVEVTYGSYITSLLPIILFKMEPTEDDGVLMCYSYLC